MLTDLVAGGMFASVADLVSDGMLEMVGVVGCGAPNVAIGGGVLAGGNGFEGRAGRLVALESFAPALTDA